MAGFNLYIILHKTSIYIYVKTIGLNKTNLKTPGNIFLHQIIFNIHQPLAFIVKRFNHIMISLFLYYVISTTFITNL